MIVDFLRMMRSFMHKNNWEETKLFVSSVPRSSMISRSLSRIKSSPGSVSDFSGELCESASSSNRSNAEKYKTQCELSRSSLAIQWERKVLPTPVLPIETDSGSALVKISAQSSRQYRKPAVLSRGLLILLLHFSLYQNTSQKKSAQKFSFLRISLRFDCV